jgi:hypothetical protein
MNPVHERDACRCVRCGQRAESVHHRIHGNRSDNRASNRLSTCGDGTTGCHGWIEDHWTEAEVMGWTVSKHAPGGHVDTAALRVWMENGPYGRGWYLLDDEGGLDRLWEVP